MSLSVSPSSLTFAQWLLLKRRQAGLRQKDVADAIGRSHKTISSWETGDAVPRLTPKEMQILCQILNCTLDELAGYDTAA
ncbi:helix-turn-helix transcriptional regulator [Leptolyngbya sp. FACHB-17]|uniref:helix-turn-helix transcriptional regulator n=1 Tax=unclassified Leptolyngbya TaxID=2650499 RepID=UPI001F555587|nr:helix-turn-helix transcriptional regulator [Leptolyngbya sp. FACHB-17]